ncbi:hypothetical protein, partial [Actinoplanes sp. NPDC005259]
VVAGCGAVTHGGQLAAGEELKLLEALMLPHGFIIPGRPTLFLANLCWIMPTYRRNLQGGHGEDLIGGC